MQHLRNVLFPRFGISRKTPSSLDASSQSVIRMDAAFRQIPRGVDACLLNAPPGASFPPCWIFMKGWIEVGSYACTSLAVTVQPHSS